MGRGLPLVQTVNGLHPGSLALPAQVSLSSPSLNLPEGLKVNHMFQMLDCHTVSQKCCLGESIQSKLCLYTRGPGVFLLCRIIHFLTHRHPKPPLCFCSPGKASTWQCEPAAEVCGEWERAALLSLTKERRAPSITDLIYACARALGQRPHFTRGSGELNPSNTIWHVSELSRKLQPALPCASASDGLPALFRRSMLDLSHEAFSLAHTL